MRYAYQLALLLVGALVLLGCAGEPEATPPDIKATVDAAVSATQDVEATIDAAVAATLTAATPAALAAPSPIPESTLAPTATPAPTVAPAPTATPTATPAPTVAPAPTATPTATPAPTVAPAPTATPTATPAPTAAPAPTATPTATPAPTVAPAPTATPTATPVPTAAPAPTATPSIGADLELVLETDSFSAERNREATYIFTVTNRGPRATENVALDFSVDDESTLVFLSPLEPCERTGCRWDYLNANESVSGELVVRPKLGSNIRGIVDARVYGSEADPERENNSASISLPLILTEERSEFVLWSTQTTAPVGHSVKLLISEDRLYMSSRYQPGIYAFDKRDGKLLWQFETVGHPRTGLIVDNDEIYFGSSDGYLNAISSTTGDLLWQLPFDDMTKHPIEFLNNVLYFLSGNYLYAFSVRDREILWKYEWFRRPS